MVLRRMDYCGFVFLLLCATCSSSPDNRVAVLVRGESFRVNSSQFSRARGAEGFEDQRHAVRNHMEKLLLPLVFELNYSVDVYIESYSTPFDQDLVRWYGAFLQNYSFVAFKSSVDDSDPLTTSACRQRRRRRYEATRILGLACSILTHLVQCPCRRACCLPFYTIQTGILEASSFSGPT